MFVRLRRFRRLRGARDRETSPTPIESGCDNGYRFAKYEGKPNPRKCEKLPENKGFCDSMTLPSPARSCSIHRDT
jgi:hypothetical protein